MDQLAAEITSELERWKAAGGDAVNAEAFADMLVRMVRPDSICVVMESPPGGNEMPVGAFSNAALAAEYADNINNEGARYVVARVVTVPFDIATQRRRSVFNSSPPRSTNDRRSRGKGRRAA